MAVTPSFCFLTLSLLFLKQNNQVNIQYLSRQMSSNNRINEATVRQSLEGMLKSISNHDHISYFEFLVMARQLNFRFDSADSLGKLKAYFQKSADRVPKDQFLKILQFRGNQIVNNTRVQLVAVKGSPPVVKNNAISESNIKMIKTLQGKLEYLRAFLQQFHGKTPEDWFRIFDIQGKGSIKFYEIKWTLKTFMNQYINDNEIKLIYKALEKDRAGSIHPYQFAKLFRHDQMKVLLEQAQQASQEVEMPVHQIKMRQYPLVLLNQQIGNRRPSHQQSGLKIKRSVLNHGYGKRRASLQIHHKQMSNGATQAIKQKDKMRHTFAVQMHPKTVQTESSQFGRTSASKMYLPKKKNRSTRTCNLRRKFIEQWVLERQKTLQQERFRTHTSQFSRSQVFGKSILN